jgi:hypothetical protein
VKDTSVVSEHKGTRSPDVSVRRLFFSATGWKSELELWSTAIFWAVLLLLFLTYACDFDFRELLTRFMEADVNRLPEGSATP